MARRHKLAVLDRNKINTWGRRGLPKCGRHESRVWCGGKISTRRRAKGLLPVLHLGSVWPGSPWEEPYKCQARLLIAWLRHLYLKCACAQLSLLRPYGGAIEVGEWHAHSWTSRMASRVSGADGRLCNGWAVWALESVRQG